jgi:catechol 2,3-dioxygenase-like lactoylglutathione lyase family enzyme
MPTIVGGHHVAFTVRDADRTAKWYEDLLGMQVALRGDDDSVRFRRGPGNIQLEFWLPAGQ